MGSVRVHTQKGTLFLDFRYQGKRCREYTALSNNATNVARLQRLLTKLEGEIADGTFDYEATLSPCRAAAHERVLERQSFPRLVYRTLDHLCSAFKNSFGSGQMSTQSSATAPYGACTALHRRRRTCSSQLQFGGIWRGVGQESMTFTN